MRIDTREFAQALREYVAATGKDSVEAVNRQGKNFAIHCIKHTKRARGAAAIRALANEPWWPKFIAKVIGSQAGAGAASDAYRAQWSAQQKAMRDAAGRKGAWKLTKQETSYVRYAKAMSKKILGSRTKAISFLTFFFRVLAQRMGQFTKGGAVPGGKNFPDFATAISPATRANMTLKLDSAYNFRRRGAKTSARTEKLLQDAINRALPATVQDMRDYTAKKLEERGREYSGRRAVA